MIGDKWNAYVKMVAMEKQKNNDKKAPEDLDIEYIEVGKGDKVKKSIEGKVLDDLELHKYCCRRMMLGNVHLISYI
tara:strand:- start:250 stop:477 length:228 start_codon:yes stop_codon:yes gene_type:complete